MDKFFKTSAWLGILFSLFVSVSAMLLINDALAEENKTELKVPEKTALKLRDDQVRVLLLERQIVQLNQQKAQADQTLQVDLKAAYAEAKLKEDDYTIDDREWKFVAVPKPAAPAAAPASEKK